MPGRASISAGLLEWARTSAGFDIEAAAEKLGVKAEQIHNWESGQLNPTFGQLRRIADVYKRPFGVFLRETAPDDPKPPHDFRRLLGSDAPSRNGKLNVHLRAAAEKRASAIQLLEELDEKPAKFEITASVSDDPEEVGKLLRKKLKVEIQEQAGWRQGSVALAAWKRKLEASGVLVFQFSGVPVSEMRGTSIAEFPLPVVAVNAKDSDYARCFTLMHELSHIALRRSGICDIDEDLHRSPDEQKVEVFCNKVAAATLVPLAALFAHPTTASRGAGQWSWTDAELDTLRRSFGVSKYVVLRRLVTAGRASEDYYRSRHQAWEAEAKAFALEAADDETNVVVPVFRRALAANGREFSRIVLRAYYEDKITLNEVSEYLRVKVRHLAELEREAFR